MYRAMFNVHSKNVQDFASRSHESEESRETTFTIDHQTTREILTRLHDVHTFIVYTTK